MMVLVSGCGGTKGLSDLNTAQGIIMLDGVPLEGASITLDPVNGGRGAGCVSDEKGVFKLQTLQAGDGVADGEYLVGVTKMRVENPYTEEESRLLSESGKRHNDVFNGKDHPKRPEPTSVNELPEKYKMPKTSGLSLTISGASKDLKLELSSN